MHLGRFHKVVWDLQNHFKLSDLHTLLESAATALDAHAGNKTPETLAEFNRQFKDALDSAAITDEDLYQPYAQEVIQQMGIGWALGEVLSNSLTGIIGAHGFDQVGISAELRAQAKKLKALLASLEKIRSGFDDLSVEYERINEAEEESEVGLLLPREIVGETIPQLTTEFDKFGHLFRAINELTGAEEYDPRIRTISSSEWQIFLSMSPDQILIWVLVIERIVALFKSNLEIKNLQQGLAEKGMPKKITELIEKEIEKSVGGAIEKLADEIVSKHAKNVDANRKSELTNQLRFGLKHLANRMNHGAQIEINVGVPDEPADAPTPAEGGESDSEVLRHIAAQRQRIEVLRELRARGVQASMAVTNLKSEPQALLPYLQPADNAAEGSASSSPH